MRLLLLASLPLLLATPAAAFDCTKAASPLDKAICADPKALAQDDQMAAIYGQVRGALDEAGKAGLLGDQRYWLRQRSESCVQDKKVETSCIIAMTEARTERLTGYWRATQMTPAIQPWFRTANDRKLGFEVVTVTPRLVLADAAKAKIFNQEAETHIGYDEQLAEKKSLAAEEERPVSYEAGYEVALSNASLISVSFYSYDYSGGAHGLPARSALAFDPVRGRVLTRKDLFQDEPKLLKTVETACRADFAKRNKDDLELFEDADLKPVIEDFGAWLFEAGKITIRFDVYTIAPYSSGEIDCSLPNSVFTPFLKPGIKLPA